MLKKLKIQIKERTIGKILIVVMGNIALLFAKCIIWLIIPKLLGVTEYGYYKIFTLYLAYAMILHFGFSDGVLLLYGGKDYKEINEMEFRMYSRFFSFFQGGIFLICIIIGFTVKNVDRYLLCMLGSDIFFINMSTYFKFISQAIMRFEELTRRNILESLLQISAVLLMFILSKMKMMNISGRLYILFLVIIDALILLWYLPKYRQIILGISEKINWLKIRSVFCTGILLTLAFQVSHLVFILDRQMVSLLFDLDTYALYSFAYSITNLVTMTINAVSVVLFPSLKRLELGKISEQYSIFMAGITIAVFFMLTGYYPLIYFIQWFLPEYAGALQYIGIIFPGLAIHSCINIIIFTYYKVLNRLKQYTYICLLVLIIGFLLNVLGYKLFETPIIFSIASIITLLIWYLFAQKYIFEDHRKMDMYNFGYICIMVGWFYLINYFIQYRIITMIIYLMGFFLITFVYGLHLKAKIFKYPVKKISE